MISSSPAQDENWGWLRALWNRNWLKGLLLVAAVFFAYQPVWHAGFIWDDDGHVTKPELRSLDGLARIWTQLGATQQYYPLVHSVFWVEHKVWGDSTLGYHLANILLHALSALLLARILRQLKIPGAWLAAAIFALHPVQVESVAWISELKNTLSGVCYLGAALAYLGFDRNRNGGNYALALGLFVLGLLSKTVIATLPAALLVVFWWQRGKLSWKQDVRWLVPFFIAGIGAGLLTAWVERKFIGAEGSEFNFSHIERCLIAGRAIWFYLGKLFWPEDLVFIYPRWKVSQAAMWQYLYPGAALLLLGGLWWVRRRWRWPLAGLLFFAGTLFPALGFFNVYPFIYSLVADHFQYLAGIGPIALVAACISTRFNSFSKWRSFLGLALCGTLLAVLCVLTRQQSRMYADPETLWHDTLAKNPDAWMAHNNLGHDLLQKGQLNEAIIQFQKVLEIKPEYAAAHNNLGLVYFRKGQVDEAMEHYQKALKIRPQYVEAHDNFGTALLQKGRVDEAVEQYQKALEIQSNYVLAHYNLGVALAQKGLLDEAIDQFRKTLEIQSNYLEAYNNLGIALAHKGLTDEAIVQFRKALEIQPNNSETHNNLGNALLQKGRVDEAILHFQMAVAIRPEFAKAHNNLGYALLQKGRVDEAISHFQKALEIRPNYPDAGYNLAQVAWLLATSPKASVRNGVKAVALAEQMVRLSGAKDPMSIRVLAAAYAEAGRFAEAIETAERAQQLAAQQGNTILIDALVKQIKLYQAGTPFRDTSLPVDPTPLSRP
jgi:tetratricopeptide (TPR) repeat protein